MKARFQSSLLLLMVTLSATVDVEAHGSVKVEDDLCAIQIGYFKAHFKIYLPESREHDEFCEDLPASGEAVFVMEYIHPGLGDIPIDFRIIRDVTGMGRFAKAEHVEAIPDLDAVTVFYREATVEPDVFTTLYRFSEPGEFIGIVTARPAPGEAPYLAVFPFEVGFTGFGYWPAIVVLVLFIQLNYLYMSGRIPFKKRSRIRSVPGPAS